jgi:hypothetical protein
LAFSLRSCLATIHHNTNSNKGVFVSNHDPAMDNNRPLK